MKNPPRCFAWLGPVCALFFGGCETVSAPPVAAAPAPMLTLAQIGGDIFEPSKLDQAPVGRSQRKPTYPFELRRAGVSGGALVDFIVDTEGRVRNARALKFNHEGFATAAVECVSAWTFRPGMKNGRPVNTHMQVPIIFTTNDDR